MTAIKVPLNHFSGNGRVYTREPTGLAAILRGLAIDNARLKVEVSSVHDFTDDSTGTASSIAALPLPVTALDVTAAGGAQTVALAASLVKVQNAGEVMTNTINEASALLGLPANVSASGAQVTADTIPALDLSGTASNGATAASFASTVASFQVAKDNFARLLSGANAVLVAIGAAPLSDTVLGNHAIDLTLAAIPAPVSVSAGPGGVALADTTAFLSAYANNVATLAAAWNAAMNQGTPGALHVVAG